MTAMTQIGRKVAGAVLTLAATATTLLVAAPASQAAVCGFWENHAGAYYEHCNAPKAILIRVDRAGGGVENDYCRLVTKTRTYLGTPAQIDHAYYISSGICPV
ncbi:DUF6355 family natural product biosynthesis protein [Saccharothrix sp. AJ9571]|nr:DUF6355 family natural product biosynthesis protein [Saccharothrix sp. AJ9571]